MAKITVQNTPITILSLEEQDYISLTDMATAKEGDNRSADIIKNWLRNRYTIEFLGTWEVIHNPDFKVVEFDHFRMSAGLPSFVLITGSIICWGIVCPLIVIPSFIWAGIRIHDGFGGVAYFMISCISWGVSILPLLLGVHLYKKITSVG
jgi:hypothetical protein